MYTPCTAPLKMVAVKKEEEEEEEEEEEKEEEKVNEEVKEEEAEKEGRNGEGQSTPASPAGVCHTLTHHLVQGLSANVCQSLQLLLCLVLTHPEGGRERERERERER